VAIRDQCHHAALLARLMTYTRYKAYRHLMASLRLTNLTDPERELLRDAAEGFLLASSYDSEEVAELTLTVVVTLEGVVASGRMSRWSADHTKSWIDACGPMPESRALAGVA
jgi:hypothetical protein